jgi:hypothetical protein
VHGGEGVEGVVGRLAWTGRFAGVAAVGVGVVVVDGDEAPEVVDVPVDVVRSVDGHWVFAFFVMAPSWAAV